jgi:tetratricopeptide (TPR) repeat protein
VARDYAYHRLNAANDLLMEEKVDEALVKLRELEKSGRTNDYERALMLQTFGFAYHAKGDYAKSVEAFEAIESGVLEPHAELNMLYNLGQLYVVLDRTGDGIATLERWFRLAKNPTPPAYIALANAYVQAERYADALPLVEKACASSSEPAESWLQLLVALHSQNSHWAKAAGVLEDLIERYPRKTYWLQLSAAYGQLGRERDSMIALELGNLQSPLSEEAEVTRLAQLLLHNEIPYKAARVIERGIADGRVDGDRKSYELLATSLLQAREVARALAPLEKAASLASDGELWLRLAQLRIAREEWDEADRALREAQTRGGLERPGLAALLGGITQLHRGELVRAGEAFDVARSFPDTRRMANEYIHYLDALRVRKEARAEGLTETPESVARRTEESTEAAAHAGDSQTSVPPAAPAD